MLRYIDFEKQNRRIRYRHRRIGLISFVIIFPLAIIFLWSPIPILSFTIKPQNYSINYAFWNADLSYNAWTPAELISMNQNNLTLITTFNNESAADWFPRWNTDYPNISFWLTFYPSPNLGSYVWEGSSSYVINQTENAVLTCISENYTNVKGVIFDFEPAFYPGENATNISANLNPVQRSISLQEWQSFFSFMTINAPNWQIGCCYFLRSDIDVLMGNNNLDTFWGTFSYQLPFTNFIPMLYRGQPITPENFSYININSAMQITDFSDNRILGSYQMYVEMALHAQVVKKQYGNLTRAGVALGDLNTSIYGNSTQVSEFSRSLGTGFDVLIQDILTAKNFRIPLVVLYPSNLFQVYGEDSLNQIEERTNGIEMPQSFIIQAGDFWGYFVSPSYGGAFLLNWGLIFFYNPWIVGLIIIAMIGISLGIYFRRKYSLLFKVLALTKRWRQPL